MHSHGCALNCGARHVSCMRAVLAWLAGWSVGGVALGCVAAPWGAVMCGRTRGGACFVALHARQQRAQVSRTWCAPLVLLVTLACSVRSALPGSLLRLGVARDGSWLLQSRCTWTWVVAWCSAVPAAPCRLAGRGQSWRQAASPACAERSRAFVGRGSPLVATVHLALPPAAASTFGAFPQRVAPPCAHASQSTYQHCHSACAARCPRSAPPPACGRWWGRW